MHFLKLDLEPHSVLDDAGVNWQALTETELDEAELHWRDVYGSAFSRSPRLRQGTKADFEYSKQIAEQWLILPLQGMVDGTTIHPDGIRFMGYSCEGPLTLLGDFYNVEFAIAPRDLSWTMLHTHEDYAMGGPYFIHRDWIV